MSNRKNPRNRSFQTIGDEKTAADGNVKKEIMSEESEATPIEPEQPSPAVSDSQVFY